MEIVALILALIAIVVALMTMRPKPGKYITLATALAFFAASWIAQLTALGHHIWRF